MFTLEQLLEAGGGRVVRGRPRDGQRFTGGVIDSRVARPQTVFFALRDQRDGHDFVAAALAGGSSAAVVERIPEGVPDDALLVVVPDVRLALRRVAERIRAEHPIPGIGITGSVGKTTTKEFAVAALGARFRVLRSEASFNNELGVPLTFLGLEATHEVCVIELGFYVPGEIADLCRLVRPTVGIVTAIPDRPPHFSRTPSLEAIASGKAELLEALPADGTALLNADDARVRGLAGRTRAQVILFGESSDATVRATEVQGRGPGGLAGTSFVVSSGGTSAPVVVPLPGRHLVTGALAAIGAAVALGVPLVEAATCVGTLEPPPHRMSVRRTSDGLVLIDDSYNASPAAVLAALTVLGGVGTRRIAVLGDMLELGALSSDAHEAVGREAARSCDLLIGVGELAATIVRVARSEGLALGYHAQDRVEALVLLRRLCRPGDTILIKGSHALALDELADALVAPGQG